MLVRNSVYKTLRELIVSGYTICSFVVTRLQD